MKRIRSKKLIFVLSFLVLVLSPQLVYPISVRIFGGLVKEMSVREIVYTYLRIYLGRYENEFPVCEEGVEKMPIVLKGGLPLGDYLLKILDYSLKIGIKKYDNILAYISKQNFPNWRSVIAATNAELLKLEPDKFKSFREKLLASSDFADFILPAIEAMGDEKWLELKLNDTAKADRILVYPLESIDYLAELGVGLDEYDRGEVVDTLKEFIISNVIQTYLTGMDPRYIVEGIFRAAELYQSNPALIDNYFGDNFNKQNPEQLSALFSFGTIKALLLGNPEFGLKPLKLSELISTGLGSLVDELEALQNDWLVRRNEFGEIIDQRTPSQDLVDKYIKNKIAMAVEFQNLLNESNYYGESVSL